MKKTLRAALVDLKKQQANLEKKIRELVAARQEKAKIVTAIRDIEHALKAMVGSKGSGKKRKKPGPKPKAKKVTKKKAKAKKKPGPKPKKAKKATRKKAAKKKTTKKKTNRSKAWTPAKRAAMARKVKAYWAKKKKAG